MQALTNQQSRVLNFLHRHREEAGIPPSTREIQRAFGFRSQTSAVLHLRALERKGAVRRLAGTARGWVPVRGSGERRLVEVPVYGCISAGMPGDGGQEAAEYFPVDAESLDLPEGDRVFGLRVRGDSMIGAHIESGDMVIMEFRPPVHGEIVAALIDGETTLKRYLIKGGKPFLRAENPDYPDLIPARELVIQGVMRCLIRKMKQASGRPLGNGR